MAKIDNAVLKVGVADFYTAVIGTPRPADLKAPGAAWEHMGHTSLTDILNAAGTGGESTVLGSLQNKQLMETVSSRTEAYNINLLQWDQKSLVLFYGANSEVTEEGDILPPTDPVPTECAWLVVLHAGTRVAGIHAPKASIYRNGDFSIADADSLTQLPLSIKPLTHADNKYTIRVIPPVVADVTP